MVALGVLVRQKCRKLSTMRNIEKRKSLKDTESVLVMRIEEDNKRKMTKE